MANTPNVKQISECFIKPKHEVEDAKKPVYLAPGDLFLVSGHCIQTGLLYSNKPDSMNTILINLKLSLSLALVHFYPLAGQLETEIDEEQHTTFVFINCNKGPGARFIHATLDMNISEILSPQDVPRIVHSFFDDDRAANRAAHENGKPLLSIQVTELVDGVFVGISMNHVCGDGTSYWNFFNTLSEIFMQNEKQKSEIMISRPPIHQRWFLDGYGPMIKLPFIIVPHESFIERLQAPDLRERIFHFSADSISKLKVKANEENINGGHSKKISSFQALSALVWRCITRARRSPNDSRTTYKLALGTRGRLRPPLSDNLFGNATQAVQGECKVGELLSQDLGFAALKLHQAVEEHTDEKVRNGVKSWMESPIIVQNGSHCETQSVLIGCSARYDVYGNEFGMGKPLALLSGYANKFDGKLSSFPGREGGGSIDLEIILSPEAMFELEFDEEFMEVVS